MPVNDFKRRISSGPAQIGLWLGLANAYSAEICAGAGFDWLVLDAEHAPNDISSLLAQLQALAPYPSQAVVRIPSADPIMVKRVLDIGAQTILVPGVNDEHEALELARAMRYPPAGTRGVGTSLARAARWNQVPNYLQHADAQVCLVVQIETQAGLDNIAKIAAVDGVDGLFVGPSDLAAALGHLGNSSHPDVQAAVERAIVAGTAAGRPVGILALNEPVVRRYLELGCRFVAVGLDTALLSAAASSLMQRYRRS